MPDQSSTKWNTPKNAVSIRLETFEDYVLIGRNSDGSTITMSNGDQQFASKLLQSAGHFKTQGENA